MDSTNKNWNSARTACVFASGAALGVGLALLFTPKSGAATREIIRKKALEGRDEVLRRGQEIADEAAKLVAKGKDTLQTHRRAAEAAIEAGKVAYRSGSAV